MNNISRWARWLILLAAIAGMVILLSRPFWVEADRAIMRFLDWTEQPQIKLDFMEETDTDVPASTYGIIRIILTMILTALLGALVAMRGDRTRLERSSILEAHMVLSVAAALMMMIIGSQIARAFGLMGAASIVRYRYSLRSPKEASSLIIALGVGMACGTGLYILGTIAAVFVVALFWLPRALPRWFKGSWGTQMNHYQLSIVSSDMEATTTRLQARVDGLSGILHLTKVREKQGKYRIQAMVALPARVSENDLTRGLMGNEVKSFEWESLKGKKE